LKGGSEIARDLARNLGCPCLSREDLIEGAFDEGIQVGKLETAIVKSGGFTGRLAIEREHYQAFSTAFLLDRAVDGPLVYHGRTGHLLLMGLDHVLRARVLADREFRIQAVGQRLGLDRDKSRRYLEQVDEDRRRWATVMYGTQLDDASQYGMTINLAQMGVDNAVAALTVIAQLPDFQLAPADLILMQDMRLAAKARLQLARDERTHGASFKVRADRGIVTVTYLPQDSALAPEIPRILQSLEGLRELRATMATTSVLWIQETFDAASEAFRQVVNIATKWNAAVELRRLAPEGSAAAEGTYRPAPAAASSSRAETGGIEDDVEEDEAGINEGGLRATADELARMGRSGGGRIVSGGEERLLGTIDRSVPYSLVVVGNVFLSKAHGARTRLARELRASLAERLRIPVVGVEELGSVYLFGKKDFLRLLTWLVVVVALYLFVFTHQRQVLEFLTRTGWKARTLATVVVVVSIPLVASVYGTVARLVLKWIQME